jgi:zinc transport system substrate-binding protein
MPVIGAACFAFARRQPFRGQARIDRTLLFFVRCHRHIMQTSRRLILLVLVLPAAAWLSGCGGGSQAGSQKPIIAASIYPVADLVSQLTGGWADVVTLLPEGAEEHDFELTATQVRQMSQSELLVLVGDGLDPWAEPKPGSTIGGKVPEVVRMADLIRKAPNKDAAADSIGTNNHLWLDPVLVSRFVSAMADRLGQRYPEHRHEIEINARRLSADLEQIDRQYRSQLSAVRRKELITFHNAFDLIAGRYGLKIVARLTDIEADPHGGVTPQSYLAAINAIKKYKLSVIYLEPEFSAEQIDSLRRSTGVDALTLDPLGGPRIDGYHTYQEMMESNLATLVRGQDSVATSDLPANLTELGPIDDPLHRKATSPDFGLPDLSSSRLPSTLNGQRPLMDPAFGLPPSGTLPRDRSLLDPSRPNVPKSNGS